MDQAKADFLFPNAPERADLDDPDGREELLRREGPPDPEEDADQYRARLLVWQVIANQVADDDPPDVWAAAQRMMASGVSRGHALRQISVAFAPRLLAALEDHEEYYDEAYRQALAALPLPAPSKVMEKLVELCRAGQPIDDDDLSARAIAELGLAVPGAAFDGYVDNALDELIDDQRLVFMEDDKLVEPGSFCAGAVLTHRLSEDEVNGGYIDLGVDLIDLAPFEAVTGPGGAELEDRELENGGRAWEGPEGWLAAYPVGTMVAACLAESSVQLVVLDDVPPLRPAAVDALMAAYEAIGAEEGGSHPVNVEDIFLAVMAAQRPLFGQPQAPLSDLLEAAQLEVRGRNVAHDESQWANQARTVQMIRMMHELEDEEEASEAINALRLFAEDDWHDGAALRQVLVLMGAKPRVAELVAAEMLGWPEDPLHGLADQAARAGQFAQRLGEIARKPSEISVARWLMAMAAQYSGDLEAAQAHLHLAVSSGSGWPLAVDHLAWYLSDKGEAPAAAELWRSMGLDSGDGEVRCLLPHLASSSVRPGRNEPCWCGSGRKYKQCHHGRTELAPLPDRVPWLLNKAVNFLHRNRRRAAVDIIRVASARAGDDFSDAEAGGVFEDPLIIDLVMTEGGWWERFVAERGQLLPDDEALLATSWLLVQRTVYEVLRTSPGAGMTVKDLRTGDDVEVSERTFSQGGPARAAGVRPGRA